MTDFLVTTSVVFLCAAACAFYGAYCESWDYISEGRDIPYRQVWLRATRAAFLTTACAIVAQLVVSFLQRVHQ